mgnify:CR=1 FL=1
MNEASPVFERDSRLNTSKISKEWTESSPNSKLSTIKERLDSVRNKSADVIQLNNLLNSGDYRELQRIVWCPNSECDGKLWKNSLRYFWQYLDRILKQNSIISHTSNQLDEFKRDIREVANQIDTTHIQNNAEQYLAQNETMSYLLYDRLFSWKEKLWQWQLWDCYLVSWVHELARTQMFDELMRTSIQRMKWGNWDLGYQIMIPVWIPNWRKILIKDSEFSVAKIRGWDWYKLLELAYAKNKLRPNNHEWNIYKPMAPSELKGIEGGRTHEVLRTFLWKDKIGFNDFWTNSNYWNNKTLESSSPETKKQIVNFLKHYNPEIWNKFVSLASLPWDTDTSSYKVWWKTIYRKHAYSITWVTKDRYWNIKYITVLNPWNEKGEWESYQHFTLNEFFSWFSAFHSWKVISSAIMNWK